MSSKKGIAVLGFVLAINAPGAIASPPPAENDGDPVLNNVEYWMQRWGALVGIPAVDNASPTPQPILAWTANTYVDTDSDGIPDVVEMLFTHTDPAVRDDVACAGGGSPDLTGQYEVRRAANLGTPVDFLADELSAISVCHTSNSPGGIRVFEPRMGYATSASISGSGPYTLSANWNYLGTAVAFTGNCPSPCTGANIVVTGSLSIGGALAAAEARRRATAAPSAASVNGLYAGQVTHFPHQAGASQNKLQDLGSAAIQINYLYNSQATVYTKDTFEAFPAYYSALTGTVFYTSYFYYNAFKDPYDPANSNDDVSRIALMFTEAPVSGVGGRIRGSETELYTSPGQAIAVTENQIYGKASLPNTGGVTLNRSVGIGTLLYLNNVPVSADAVTVSGPAITTSTIWSDLDTDYFNDRSLMVSYGARIPGFTDGEKVGLASDGTSLDVSSIYRLFQSPLANNTYDFNFSGAEGGFGTISVPYTNRSSTPLPVVTNVQLDGSPLTAGRQKSLTGEDLSVDRVLSWSRVDTGGINGTGAGLYRVIITDPFHGVIYPPASITVPSPDTVSFFVDPADASNPCASDCTVTIPGGTLANSTPYRIEIEARDKGDPNNRSITDRYYLNTKPFVPGDFNLDHTYDILWRRAADGAVVQWLMAFGSYSSTYLGGGPAWTVINTSGDFNDDGRADILWRRSDGAIEQWLMSGSARIASTVLGGDNDWSIVQIGDFNGDGKSDILWRQVSTGVTLMSLMDGSAPAKEAALSVASNWTVIQIGDFNGDGKSDVLWHRPADGAVSLWLMDGFTRITSAYLGGSSDWKVVEVGDFNGDGKSDILWRRVSDGAVSLWLMDGTSHSSAGLGGSSAWEVIQIGDFNGDGKSDILWHRPADGAVSLWLMDGSTRIASAVLGGNNDWKVVKVGDFDSDGKSDILWHRTSDGAVSLWLMDGTSHVSTNLGALSGWAVVP